MCACDNVVIKAISFLNEERVRERYIIIASAPWRFTDVLICRLFMCKEWSFNAEKCVFPVFSRARSLSHKN